MFFIFLGLGLFDEYSKRPHWGKWQSFGNYQTFNIHPNTLGTDSFTHSITQPRCGPRTAFVRENCHLTILSAFWLKWPVYRKIKSNQRKYSLHTTSQLLNNTQNGSSTHNSSICKWTFAVAAFLLLFVDWNRLHLSNHIHTSISDCPFWSWENFWKGSKIDYSFSTI